MIVGIISLILIIFVIGLLSRDKGDNFMDTLGSGCSTIFWIILIIVIILIYAGSQK